MVRSNLPAYFPTRMGRRMHVDIGDAGADRLDHLGKALGGCTRDFLSRNGDDIGLRNRPVHRPRAKRAGRFTAPSAEEGNNGAADAALTDMNVGSQYVCRKIFVHELIRDGSFVVADSRVELTLCLSND